VLLVVNADTRAEPLERVRQFRQAARQILRQRWIETADDRTPALLNLVRRARQERYSDLIIRAITAEVLWSIDREDVSETRYLADPLERRHRQMRAEGFAACPRCLSPLSTALEWQAWHELREGAIRELEAREVAVPAYVAPS
jgi:hypothetical protein